VLTSSFDGEAVEGDVSVGELVSAGVNGSSALARDDHVNNATPEIQIAILPSVDILDPHPSIES
jgi:hypothetical protein